jgi:Ribbon-helix-helix protein, copG family
MLDMVCHIKTTLKIDDTVMARLRHEAVRRQKTMSELVEAALRLLFQAKGPKSKPKLRPLPTWNGGKPRVDIADRNALYDFMEGRR